MQTWLIYDYALSYLLRANGFHCERHEIPGATCTEWYVTDCPIPLDGDYTLADGTVIQGCAGIELRIKSKEEAILPGD
jgi:hypothetical protein